MNLRVRPSGVETASPVTQSPTSDPNPATQDPMGQALASFAVPESRVRTDRFDPSLAPDLSTIPDEIRVLLEGTGKIVSLASSRPNYISMRSLSESYPVSVDHDVPESNRDTFRHLCRRNGFVIDPSGMVRRGDCVLYVQSAEARDYELEVAHRISRSFEFDSTDTARIKDALPPDIRKLINLHMEGPDTARTIPLG